MKTDGCVLVQRRNFDCVHGPMGLHYVLATLTPAGGATEYGMTLHLKAPKIYRRQTKDVLLFLASKRALVLYLFIIFTDIFIYPSILISPWTFLV